MPNTDELTVDIAVDVENIDDLREIMRGEIRKYHKQNDGTADDSDGSDGGSDDGSDGSGGGDIPDAELQEMVDSALGELGVEGELEKVRAARRAVAVPGHRLGPDKLDSGAMHTPSMWGIRFRTRGPAHIRRTTVDAGESGTFTATVGKYDGASFTEVDAREVEVEEGKNTVMLDFNLPDGGEYLLARRGNFPLRRGEWNGWDSDMANGVRLIAGAKPDNIGSGPYPDNTNFYYFFGTEIAGAEGYHLNTLDEPTSDKQDSEQA